MIAARQRQRTTVSSGSLSRTPPARAVSGRIGSLPCDTSFTTGPDPGPRRICPPGAGGGRGRLHRCCAPPRRLRRDDDKINEQRRWKRPPFAPPFLKAGTLVIAQTGKILLYLGPRLNLVPRGSRPIVGAAAATHHHRSGEGNSRHPSPARTRALLRGSEAGGKTRTEEFWRTACRNFSAISSVCCSTSGP